MKKLVLIVIVLAVTLLSVDSLFAQDKAKEKTKKTVSAQKKFIKSTQDSNDTEAAKAKEDIQKKLEDRQRRRAGARERVRGSRGAPGIRGQAAPKRLRRDRRNEAARVRAEGVEGSAIVEGGIKKGSNTQIEAIDKLFTQEKDKHAERIAKLNRIKELAAGKDDAQKNQKIDQLIEKEQKRFEIRTQRIEMKRQRVTAASAAKSEKLEKAKDKSDDKEDKEQEKED